ncbi:MAG: hypothetical protein KIS63_14795 [Caldilineales bacterium]|nr:hypothetical protein [Caldilineales bacterium]
MLAFIKAVLWAIFALIIAAAALLGIGQWTYNRRVSAEVRGFFARQSGGQAAADVVVSEAMLDDLPAPLRRYLTYSGVIGQPIPHTVRLHQVGQFRTAPTQPWLDITADEYYTVDEPGFVWDATFYMAGVPFMRIRDRYTDGEGNIRMTVWSLVPAMDRRSAGLNQGALLRYFNELATWFPAALLKDNVTYRAIDDETAEVTFTDRGQSVSAILYVDAEGRLTNFIADRYQDGVDEYRRWATPLTVYGEQAGLRLPLRGQGVWLNPEGDFEYINLEVTEIVYDDARS